MVWAPNITKSYDSCVLVSRVYPVFQDVFLKSIFYLKLYIYIYIMLENRKYYKILKTILINFFQVKYIFKYF